MSKKKHIISLTLAAAAAISFASTPVVATAAKADVKCYGINACKGHNTCKTAENACKGKNGCKTHGFVMMSAKKCAKLGGTTTEPKATK